MTLSRFLAQLPDRQEHKQPEPEQKPQFVLTEEQVRAIDDTAGITEEA
jgi:hypothetical protein